MHRLRRYFPLSSGSTQFLPFRALASLLPSPVPRNATPRTAAARFENPRTDDVEKVVTFFSKNPQSRLGPSIPASLDRLSITVTPELTLEVLKRLGNAGSLAVSFFRWSEKQPEFRHSTEMYHALIDSLGKIKQFRLIWQFVDEMKRKGLLTKETFVLISRRYARARKVKEAIGAFDRMEKEYCFGYELSDFNRLIDVLCKSRNVVRAQEVMDGMKKKKKRFEFDIRTYTIMLEGWSEEKNMLRLMEVYREMKAEGFEPDVVVYGILINAHCRVQKCDEALKIFDEMTKKGCVSSAHVYCSLITGLGSAKRLEEAIRFFDMYRTSGLKPEAPTYNALVGAYSWSTRMKDAYKVLDEMRELGIGPNARTYDIILHHLVKAGNTKEAFSVFQKMSVEPTVSTYEIVMRMFCSEDRTDMAVKIWDQMKSKGVLPGMHMFSTLITSLCHEDKLADACKYFREMLDMGIRPPAPLFSKLKQCLIDGGRKSDVISLSQQIEKLRKTPLIAV